MKHISLHCAILIAMSALFFNGCSDCKAGKAVPAGMETVKISNIQSDVKKFDGKEVLLAGNYGGLCGTGCCKDFILNQGIDTIKVEPNGIRVPDFSKGLPVRVYGILKTTKSAPYIQALGIEKI